VRYGLFVGYNFLRLNYLQVDVNRRLTSLRRGGDIRKFIPHYPCFKPSP